MKRAAITSGILACLIAIPCCNKENLGSPDDPQGENPIGEIVLTEIEQEYVQANNLFAWKLFRQVAAEQRDNLVISPLSVTFTLGMVDNGAVGNVQKEINHVLGYGDAGLDAINTFCNKMLEGTLGADRRVQMELADAAVLNRDFPVKERFLKALEKYYLAKVFNPHFEDPGALDLINAWCNEKTHGTIPQIIESFSPNSEACFLNAVYFKAPWRVKFDPEETREEAFTDYTGLNETGVVDMMHLRNELLLFQNQSYSALELDFGGKAFRMMIYLPNKGKTIDDALAEVIAREGSSLGKANDRRLRDIDVKLPRFATSTDITLNAALKALGMPSAFAPDAGGFLNMSDSPSLYLGLVKQKAEISVNEEGAEAAATTIGEMVEKGTPAIEFHANRPFFYTIREYSTSSIVFMGRFSK